MRKKDKVILEEILRQFLIDKFGLPKDPVSNPVTT